MSTDQLVFTAKQAGALNSIDECVMALESIKHDRQKQLDEELRKTREIGYSEGLRQGRKAAQQELSQEMARLARSEIDSQRATRKQVVDMAIGIVKKIATNVKPENMITSLAISAAKQCPELVPFTLRVHPQNVATVKQTISDLEQGHYDETFSRIEADEALDKTDCILCHRHGRIKADLDTQLLELKRVLGT